MELSGVKQNVQITVRSGFCPIFQHLNIFECILDNCIRDIVHIALNQFGLVKKCGTLHAIHTTIGNPVHSKKRRSGLIVPSVLDI